MLKAFNSGTNFMLIELFGTTCSVIKGRTIGVYLEYLIFMLSASLLCFLLVRENKFEAEYRS